MADPRFTAGPLGVRAGAMAAALYPPVMIGIAAFVAALLCCRTLPPEYRAEAVVLREGGELDGAGEDVVAWLKSDEVLRAALTNANLPLAGELRERVEVATLSQPDESPRMAISCTATHSSAAISLANELALQLAEHYESQRRELARRQEEQRLEELRGRIRLALDAEERQREELERLRHAQLALAMAGTRGGGGNHSLPGDEGINPRWLQLKKELEALEAQRAEMIEILQPHHPEIDGINLRIAKASGSLQKTPRQLPLAPPGGRPTAKVGSAATATPLLEWRRPTRQIAHQQYEEPAAAPIGREGLDPLLNMAAQIDEAAHQLSVSTRQRKGIQSELAVSEQAIARLSIAHGPQWRTVPSRLTKTGGGHTPSQLAGGLFLALGVAGVVLLAQRKRGDDEGLASLTDLLIDVPLPIVGRVELALGDGSLAPALRTRTSVVRLITRCCEALMVGVVLTCLGASWVDLSLGEEFLHDPLGAFAETARRALP